MGAGAQGPLGPSLWIRSLLGAAGLGLGLASLSCRGVDEHVLDRRLRAATVDAYFEFLDDGFGGFEAAGVTLDTLRERHRADAVGAARPADFYAVLRRLVADLDDPHARLEVSERFWPGPIAIPEQASALWAGGSVWLAIPRDSARTPEELSGLFEAWLSGIEEGVRSGEPSANARLLARSSLAAWGRGAPTLWMELSAVDGVPVGSPLDAMLLLEGPLGTAVEVEGLMGGVQTTLGLFRNAGRFREPGGGPFQDMLGPRKLARLLDPAVPLPPAQWRWSAGDSDAQRMQQLMRGSAEVSGIEREVALEYGLEARVLRSPGGRPVAYLRIEDFEREEWPEGAPRDERDAQLLDSLCAVMGSLDAFDDWIVDLTGNCGGRWLDLGTTVSFFLPESETVIPHTVGLWCEGTRWGFLPVRELVFAHQGRVEVPHVQPGNLLVLVDQETASSGELLASSLRGMVGAHLVGERTMGAELPVAKFDAPDGSRFAVGGLGGMMDSCEHFQGTGLEPDIRIELAPPDEAGLGPIERRERLRFEALQAALLWLDRVEL